MIVRIEVTPGSQTDFIREFGNIAPAVREEPGCIEYDIYVDSTDDRFDNARRPDMVIIAEKWDSIEALQAHSRSSKPLARFRQRTAPLKLRSEYELVTRAGTEP